MQCSVIHVELKYCLSWICIYIMVSTVLPQQSVLKSGTWCYNVSAWLCEVRRPPAAISGSAAQISERFNKALSFSFF